MNKKRCVLYFFAVLIITLCSFGLISGRLLGEESKNPGDKCVECHKTYTSGLYYQWANSAHGKNGVSCLDCHGAQKEDNDSFMHNGTLVATLVTPKDCGQCHEKEMNEVNASHHAKAGEILESQDSYLANAGGGYPAAIQGCEACHGTRVVIDPKSPNKLSPKNWPNSGIGRLNPDGSKGSCVACHTRHSFSKAQARQPQSCGKCHLGPDHPQKEVYEESKHGNTYFTNVADMNLKSEKWVVGVDYSAAPTCVTCHMGATTKQPSSHDVGHRISWSLRPEISVHQENWEQKRENMKNVCSSCHGPLFVNGHYYQYDASVKLWNEKFAKPAVEIMGLIKKNNLLKGKADFSNKIDWTYYELWHHEGRRARHGAAMMGPDYTWWHGFFEVVHNFYFNFLPEAREYNNPEVNTYIDKLMKDPMHQWLSLPTDRIKQMIRNGEMQKIYSQLFELQEK